ncbi:MAG: hypothetical protein KDK70_09425 [Myxococcales bacterium]|nr:hypothetical protein [Myxococcales bacterium]
MRRVALVFALAGCHVHGAGSQPGQPSPASSRALDVDAQAPARGGRVLEGVLAVTVGSSHACARREDASVWCWGSNYTGQLGRDDVESSLVARRVDGLPAVVEIVAGSDRTCAIDRDGDVWCWGANFRGEVDANRERTPVPPWVSIVVCSRDDEDLDSRNLRFSPQRVAGVHGATHLAFGLYHSCAATPEGVSCWGSAEYGAIGGEQRDAGFERVRIPMTAPRALVAGNVHTCALDGEGQAWCWGLAHLMDDVAELPHRVQGVPPGTALAVIGTQTCLRAEDESTWCWGGERPEPADLGEGEGDGEAEGDGDGEAAAEGEVEQDLWDRFRPVPERVTLPGPWSRFIHTNGFSCTIEDDGDVTCVDEDRSPARVSIEGIGAPVTALAGDMVVCSRSTQGRAHCFSAYDDRVYVADWAGVGGRAMPVMLELDPNAPIELPEGAVVHPQARPPVEERVCRGTVGECTHRQGSIECRCDDETHRQTVDPAGVAWYDDEGCFRALAAACGPGHPEAVGVSCRGPQGNCTVTVGSRSTVSCGCASGDGMAASGEDAWTGRSDAELVEICQAQLVAECG